MTQQPLAEFTSKLAALHCKGSYRERFFSEQELQMPAVQRGNRCFYDDKGILMLYDCLPNSRI